VKASLDSRVTQQEVTTALRVELHELHETRAEESRRHAKALDEARHDLKDAKYVLCVAVAWSDLIGI
jgi:hypothetical protein